MSNFIFCLCLMLFSSQCFARGRVLSLRSKRKTIKISLQKNNKYRFRLIYKYVKHYNSKHVKAEKFRIDIYTVLHLQNNKEKGYSTIRIRMGWSKKRSKISCFDRKALCHWKTKIRKVGFGKKNRMGVYAFWKTHILSRKKWVAYFEVELLKGSSRKGKLRMDGVFRKSFPPNSYSDLMKNFWRFGFNFRVLKIKN